MPSERDKASEKQLKWWYFRPWSPIFVGTIIGGLLTALMASGTGSANTVLDTPYVKASLAMIGGAFGGVVVGVILEQISRAARTKKTKRQISLGETFAGISGICVGFGLIQQEQPPLVLIGICAVLASLCALIGRLYTQYP